MADVGVLDVPFTVFQCPRLKLKLPRVTLPGSMTVFGLVFASYFFVTSGIIYDLINEPPAMGIEPDPVTGKQRPVAIMKYRINGQYIVEGLSGGFLYCLGAAGFILLFLAADKRRSPKVQNYMLIGGGVSMALAYYIVILFIRMKLPGY